MLFSLAVSALPVYDKFTAKLVYTIPWMNNTQIADVAVDQSGKRIKYAYYNASEEIADYTTGEETKFKYARTTKNTYECIHEKADWDDTNINFVPDMSTGNWTQLDDVKMHNKLVQHYRVLGDLIEQVNSTDLNFTSVRSFQQDFYCLPEATHCTPMKWHMVSKSNHGSHYDIYDIEYMEFALGVSDEEFKFYDFNGIATCSAEPRDPNQPDGPTMTHMTQIIKKFKIRQPIKSQMTVAAQENMKMINQWRQNKEFTFTVAPNHMIDMTYEEILKYKTGNTAKLPYSYESDTVTYLDEPFLEDLPKSLDWRTRGIMTYAKDQVYCGSCWTFSAVGALEARINLDRIKKNLTDPLVTLSEQSVVDCFWVRQKHNGFDTSMGCQGGDEDDVLQQWVNQHAFATQQEYPYLGQNDWCKENKKSYTKHIVKSWHRIPPKDIVQMKRALMSGPVAVGTVVPHSYAFYAGGIYNDPLCDTNKMNITHAVVAVGWGESEFGPYWIVRNSWSPLWGQDGYIYISMKNDMCGITAHSSYVMVEEYVEPPKKEEYNQKE